MLQPKSQPVKTGTSPSRQQKTQVVTTWAGIIAIGVLAHTVSGLISPRQTNTHKFEVFVENHCIKGDRTETASILGQDGKVQKIEVNGRQYYLLLDSSDSVLQSGLETALKKSGLTVVFDGNVEAKAILKDGGTVPAVSLLEPKTFIKDDKPNAEALHKLTAAAVSQNPSGEPTSPAKAPVAQIIYGLYSSPKSDTLNFALPDQKSRLGAVRLISDMAGSGFRVTATLFTENEGTQLSADKTVSALPPYESKTPNFQTDGIKDRIFGTSAYQLTGAYFAIILSLLIAWTREVNKNSKS